jgi:peptide/nickel transport system substrate-binding protein
MDKPSVIRRGAHAFAFVIPRSGAGAPRERAFRSWSGGATRNPYPSNKVRIGIPRSARNDKIRASLIIALILAALSLSCSHSRPDPQTVTMIIEASPLNLDPRVGIDAFSERIDQLLFDGLVRRDEHFNLQPALAERWEIPDPLTYIFHLRSGVRFHNGQLMSARDVKWTFDSMFDGTVITSKTGAYQYVKSVEAPDDRTIVFRLKEPFSALLWNLGDGAIGIVPYGSGKDFSQHPIGTGIFKFVRNEQDNEVIIVRNDDYWGEKAGIERVRLAVVPDTTTRALELRKGSADIEINSVSPDMLSALRAERKLRVAEAPGTSLNYLAMNLRDPILRDVRVRQALAYAIDRTPILHYLWRDTARPANSILPPQHWAYDNQIPHYSYDPAKARALLDAAGYPMKNGVRFHLTIKSSTDEAPRIIAAVLQQQFRAVGVELDIRTFEFATFFSDITKGAYQLYTLRWVGGTNQDPDVFEYVFASSSFPPKRANRSYYSNPQVDAWIEQGRREVDQSKRKIIYSKIQQQLGNDLPHIYLWYLDNVIVHTARIKNLQPSLAGNYDFLRTISVEP